MNAFLSRWQRDYAAQRRMRWIMKAQERRESVATYFPMGGRLTLKVLAVVGFVFFVVRMWP